VRRTKPRDLALFDGDLIDIGDARLRFNWIGHERPIENDNDGFV